MTPIAWATTATNLPRWLAAMVLLIHSVALLGWLLKPIVHAIAARIQVHTLVTHQQVLADLHKEWPGLSPVELAEAISKINHSIAPLSWPMPRRHAPNNDRAAAAPSRPLRTRPPRSA